MTSDLDLALSYKTVQQLVTEKIRAAILDGTFKPNEKLNQWALSKRLNVSRIPTREALRTLEGEGLIRFYPHRGAVVAAMTPRELRDVYEIRGELEAKAAIAGMKRITLRKVAQMRKFEREMSRCRDPDRWIALNDEFHLFLYQEGGSVRLLKVIETLRNWVAAYIRSMVRDGTARTRANQDHLRIVKAVERQDSARLRAAIRQHLRKSCDAVITALRRAEAQQTLAESDGHKRARGRP